MRIFVDLAQHHVQMMRVVRDVPGRASPKKKHVIAGCVHKYQGKQHHPLGTRAGAENAFRDLVAFEVISHRRNGHCWLTNKGAQALLAGE